MLEIITRGKSSLKSAPTVPAMPRAAAVKAQPSALAWAAQAAPITAMKPSASIGLGTNPVLRPTWIQVMNPNVTTTASSPIQADTFCARS